MAGDKGTTIANAYVSIIPSADGATSAITEAVLPGMEGLGQDAGAGIGGGILEALKGMAGPIAATLSALGIGKALLDIGTEFDEMRDTIIIGTGASGEALEELVGIAESVATTVPVSFGQAGDYIQDLNTRLGLTGENLQTVATQLGALDSMIGGVNVEALSGAFAAWGISADDMASEMDYLFSVSQATGISFDSLTGILETSGPTMQNLGFSFEETANMAGLLDRAGMDASGTMSRMNRALVELAGEGGDAGEAFEQLLGDMEGYLEAGDTAAAMDIAESLFGTRGAAQFIGALQSGALSMDDLRDASLGAGNGIMTTYEATASWSEQFEVLKNKAAEALEPLASFAFETLGAGIDIVTGAFEALAPAVEPLITSIGDLLTGVVLPAAQAALETFGPIVLDIATIFSNVATGVVEAVNTIADTVAPVFDDLRSKVTDIWNGIKSAIEDPIGTARDFVGNAIDKIKGFFNFEFKWPHIPLPHFSISGSANPLDWLSNGLPSISVSWYGTGGIVDGATLIGAGERGKELIIPGYEPELSRWADALAEAGAGRGDTYYIDGSMVAADARLAAALDVVAERVGGRRRMGVA